MSNALGWKPDIEMYPSQYHNDHGQNKVFVMLKEKPGPYYDVELLLALSGLNNLRTVINYII